MPPVACGWAGGGACGDAAGQRVRAAVAAGGASVDQCLAFKELPDVADARRGEGQDPEDREARRVAPKQRGAGGMDGGLARAMHGKEAVVAAGEAGRAALDAWIRGCVLWDVAEARGRGAQMWRGRAGEEVRLAHDEGRIVMKRRSAQMGKSWDMWRGHAGEQVRLGKVARKIVLKWISSLLGLSFGTWRGHAGRQLSLGKTARRIVMKGVTSRIGRTWAAWKGLAKAARKIVSKMLSLLLGHCFGTWRGHAGEIRRLEGASGEDGGAGGAAPP
ncbi:hypothetical protein T484DRAFT_1817620 [Baffinella frigidus]|nr:hypothetical protein T484DRAFT_1817620 [Cryptophyta sp. CCMP2293]